MALDEELILLREKYYQAILYLQEKQDIIDALPEPEYNNFFNIISGLIELIDNEINKLQLLITHEHDEDMKEYMQEEIKSLELKKQICLERKKEADEIKQAEEEINTVKHRNLIFAKTNAGNVYFEDDLKDLAEEYYESVLKSLESLENEEIANEKSLSNNDKMAGIRELTPFKVRICFKTLTKDCVYVMLVKPKKSQNDKKDKDRIIDRKQKTDAEFKKIKEDLKDPVKKQQIIDENIQIKEKLIEYMNTNKRGAI